MNHCKDCQWFDRNDSGNTEYGRCSHADSENSHRSLAHVSGESEFLCVSAEFGCIQFEPKEGS